MASENTRKYIINTAMVTHVIDMHVTYTFSPAVPNLRYSLYIYPNVNSLHLSACLQTVNSAKAVKWVLVNVNRCAGLKVVKTKENLGTAN
jgi:hypothetical protein